jgi:hypothetical protein
VVSCIDILHKNVILIGTVLYSSQVNSGLNISSALLVNAPKGVVRPMAGLLPISFILLLINLLLGLLLIIA